MVAGPRLKHTRAQETVALPLRLDAVLRNLGTHPQILHLETCLDDTIAEKACHSSTKAWHHPLA